MHRHTHRLTGAQSNKQGRGHRASVEDRDAEDAQGDEEWDGSGYHLPSRLGVSRSIISSPSGVRSANRHLLAVPRFPLNTYGRRAFSVAGPMTWNSLPDFIRDPTSSTYCFGRLLKTYLLARYQCILSALAVLNDYALYKSTHSLTQSPDEKLSLLLSKRSRSLSLQRSLKTNVVHSRLLVEKKWVCSLTGLGSDPFTQPRQLSRYFCSSVVA